MHELTLIFETSIQHLGSDKSTPALQDIQE